MEDNKKGAWKEFVGKLIIAILAAVLGAIAGSMYETRHTENAIVAKMATELSMIDENKSLAQAIDAIKVDNDEKNKDIAQYKAEIAALEERINGGGNHINELENELSMLKVKLEDANNSLKKYNEKNMAELDTPNAIISGEQYSIPIQNYRAVINGHNYYSEEFLNSFLGDNLSYEGDSFYYRKDAPERVKVTENIIYDAHNIRLLQDNENYTMELVEYSDGIVLIRNGEAKISCNHYYSFIEFKLGHIDNSGSTEGDITISYQTDEGTFASSKTLHCSEDMQVQTYRVPIYNTKTVKITYSWGHGETFYLLSDIYLVK